MVHPKKIDTLQTIELAEGVEIFVRAAGPGARMLAWLIDLVYFMVWMMGISMIVGLIGTGIGVRAGRGLASLGFFVLNWFYFVFYEVRRGASPGKKSMGLKVVMLSGAPVTIGASILRNFLRTVDFLPFGYLFGVTACLSNRYFQRLGDLVAGTVVIYDRLDGFNERLPQLSQPVPQTAPSVVLNREEQLALVQFIERAGLWSTSRTEELASHLEPLVNATGHDGVFRVLSVAAWIRDS